MKQPRSRIADLIAEKTIAGEASPRFVSELAAYLLSERRVGELASIMRDVQADWAEAGYVEVLAASAHQLTTQTRQDIEKRIRALYPHAKRIIITEIIDSTLIGGVKLTLADRQLDISVKSKLRTFRQSALSKQKGSR